MDAGRKINRELQCGTGEGRDGSEGAVASDTARGRCKEEEGFLRGLQPAF